MIDFESTIDKKLKKVEGEYFGIVEEVVRLTVIHVLRESRNDSYIDRLKGAAWDADLSKAATDPAYDDEYVEKIWGPAFDTVAAHIDVAVKRILAGKEDQNACG